MPHIHIYANNSERCMQWLSIDAYVTFRQDYYRTKKADAKLKELEAELQRIVNKYFEETYESEILSNHEWNTRMNNY